MATSTLEFDCPDGMTLTAQLFALGADTALIAAAATERTTDKGSYTCSIVDIAAGTYRLRVKDAANNTIARGLLEHANAVVNERPAMTDWGSLAAPTSVVALSGTTVKAVTDAVRIQSGITKNVALANFEFFMISAADHISGKTGLTVTAQRSIDGGAFAACANAVSEVASGVYKINLAAADLNGDVVTLQFTASGADARLITIRPTP